MDLVCLVIVAYTEEFSQGRPAPGQHRRLVQLSSFLMRMTDSRSGVYEDTAGHKWTIRL